jgi:hypothetical protein
MRRLGALLLVVTGCGRLGFDDGASPDGGTPALVPPVMCETQTWDTLAFADPDVDLSVVHTASGVTAVWVANAGSDIYAANIDAGWQASAGTLIKAGSFRRVSVTSIDGQLITSEGGYGDFKIDTVASDLSGSSEQACPIADLASAPPMLVAGSDRVAMITTDIGMDVIPFDSAFASLASVLSVPSDAAPIGMAATQVGNTVEVVWSTPTTCYVEQLVDMATGTGAQSSLPCASPQLASNGTIVKLLFEAPGGVYMSAGAPMAISPTTATLFAAGANSPRIAYDNQRFWISYRDAGGQIIVGYIAPDGRFLSTPMSAAAMHDAYQLTLVNGAPWLFTADSSAFAGQRFCIPTT